MIDPNRDDRKIRIDEERISNWVRLTLIKDNGSGFTLIARASYYLKERSARIWRHGTDLASKNAAEICYNVDLPEIKLELWKEAAAYESQQRQSSKVQVGVRRNSNQGKYSATRYRVEADQAPADADGETEL